MAPQWQPIWIVLKAIIFQFDLPNEELIIYLKLHIQSKSLILIQFFNHISKHSKIPNNMIANHRVHSFFKRINCTPRFPVWCPLLTSQGVFRPVKKPLGVQNVDMPTVEKRWRPRWSIPMAQCPTMESNSFWRNILMPFYQGTSIKDELGTR